MMHASKLALFILPAIGLLGCAKIPKDAGFADVQRDVEHRTGQHIRWNHGSADDRAADAAVDQLIARGLDADRAVQIALLNNRDLQATYSSLGVAQAALVQAGLLQNPVFSGDVKFVERGGGPHVELGVAASFLDIVFIPLRQRIAASNFQSAKVEVSSAVIDLATRARWAFYRAQAAEQTVVLRRTILAATEVSYDFGTRLRKAGNITALDVANERALHEQAKLDLSDAELAAMESRERVNILLGLWGARTNWKSAGEIPALPANDPETKDIERVAVANSMDLEKDRLAVESAARALGLQNAFPLDPDTQVGAAYERDPDGTHEFGPSFSLPIPFFDQGQASRATARSQLEGARLTYYAKAVQVRSAARVARNRLLVARSRAAHFHDVLVPLREEITRQTQLQYNGMLASPFQLLEAKRNELETNISYVAALRDYWTARAELDQLISGRMSTSDETTSGGR